MENSAKLWKAILSFGGRDPNRLRLGDLAACIADRTHEAERETAWKTQSYSGPESDLCGRGGRIAGGL